ncbi:MAG: peptidoglycan-associated lipoprotein Pal [Acidobacteriota bacterium]|jgi:peptidoglycan-associated lipoprotein|nr:peptidoglycan-associated lipoprotein Pal [Acidobacteriota bacterium]
MKRSSYLSTAVVAVMLAVLLLAGGCAKKTKPTTPSTAKDETPSAAATPAASPAPTISLTASPTAIQKGESTTITWKTSNATSVILDNGIGTVEASGSRTVSPATSTTYSARAKGPGGDAVAEIRVTVSAPTAVIPPLPAITDAAYFEANIKDIFFDYDQYTLREDARAALQSNARALAERPGIRITIEGHCDERGSEKYNLALGDMRANAAKDFLISLGVNASRIDTVSFGEERPFCEEQNEECWQNNRRGHFVMR